MTVHIMLLTVLFEVLPDNISDIRNDARIIIIIGDWGAIICGSADMMITI